VILSQHVVFVTLKLTLLKWLDFPVFSGWQAKVDFFSVI